MKQWIWPFKKSPYSETTLRTRALIGLCLGGAIILGCQNLMRNSDPLSARPTEVTEDKSHIVAAIKVMTRDAASKETLFGEFDRTTCIDGLPAIWNAQFTSAFGPQNFELDLTQIAERKGLDVLVKTRQGDRLLVKLDAYPQVLVDHGLCDLPFRTEKTVLGSESEAGKLLMSVLESSANDCHFEPGKDGQLSCQLSQPSVEVLQQRAETLTRNMSTRWNHQPYLLIRRLTLSRQLLEAQDPDSRNRQKFCRVVELSLPHELPLAFRSKVWQDKVCREKTSDKSLVIMALDKSLQEIEALAHRIEDTSLVGTFTLAIPHDKSPSKEYLISLQPLDLPILVKPEVTALTSCSWHPLYSDGRDKAIIAADLSLIKTEGRAYCAPIPELARNKKEADHYVRASIASEMEFPIANGQSKLLRLPTGDYKYSITQLNGPFSEEMFTTEEIIPISIGQVSWKNDRPRLVIKTW